MYYGKRKPKEKERDLLKVGKNLSRLLRKFGVNPENLDHELEIVVADAHTYFEEILPSMRKSGFKKILYYIEQRVANHIDQIRGFNQEAERLAIY